MTYDTKGVDNCYDDDACDVFGLLLFGFSVVSDFSFFGFVLFLPLKLCENRLFTIDDKQQS